MRYQVTQDEYEQSGFAAQGKDHAPGPRCKAFDCAQHQRFQTCMDDWGRWAVEDTAQPFTYLFPSRHATEDSARAFADIMNATGSGPRKMDELWAVYDRVRRYAPLIERKPVS